MLRVSNAFVASVGAICLLALIFTLPNFFPRDTVENWPGWLPSGQINLGLDLQGGSHLLLEVDVDAVVEDRLETLESDVRLALRSERIGYRGLRVGDERVTFRLVDPAQRDAAAAAIEELNPRGSVNPTTGALDYQRRYDVEIEGDRVRIAFSEGGLEGLVDSVIEQSLEVVRRRIDELGTREPTIQRQGEDRILLQVPGERDPAALRRLLGQTAQLTFHMVDMETSPAEVRRDDGSTRRMVVPSAETTEAGEPDNEWVLRRRVELSGERLTDAQATFQENQPVVSFRFDTSGARKFADITSDNVGRLFAIVLDDEVISAPRIQEPITGGSGVITGDFTVQEANELALLLRSGALPAPLTVLQERTVGPDLGADSVAAGEIAGIIGLTLVAGFMILYYGVFGIAAVIALGVNLVLITAGLSTLGATLTLPGIAGIVLTVGMAVDANVLIFERIREEAKNGRGPIGAIDAGFKGAMRTIVDANVTTLIAAVLLFQFGSGPVRGFAVTLAIGILSSMFSAIMVTRLLVSLWYQRTRPKALPL
ncbi:MAG: protein translocase subunit SecD [Alphaproteobacteria bacterium]